jgi:4,5-DOPA dioxygenase extradiol
MNNLATFNKFTSGLKEQDHLMPVLFIGHGSPMNGIEDNEFSQRWTQMAKEIPTPAAVLVVSAHWFSKGTRITAMNFPETIHDFGGFPQELFDVQYPAPGDPALAMETAELIHSAHVELDHDWGLDHGAWTVVRRMYPEAKLAIPTPEHYLPLLYSLGLKGSKDNISFFNDKAVAGSLTMTSVLIKN